jgi:hypothetical protein
MKNQFTDELIRQFAQLIGRCQFADIGMREQAKKRLVKAQFLRQRAEQRATAHDKKGVTGS